MKTRNLFFLLAIFNLFFCVSGKTQVRINTSQVNKTNTNNGDEDKDFSNPLTKGKERDQAAIDEAINGWWTASMKNHDQRVAWWRAAKFGMFIHWGVYSQAGGEWKGKKVSGYAEHLMRKERIPRAEYLQLAHQFDPEKFNAEEWVKNAKAAGMRYMIITSKHHDGFAMYPSELSDFNIKKQTPFQRDPMAELSAACKKNGLKFGFYYSHAFDWEHPDAPGNDWEYKNPGGDSNLYGGRDWYDLHPELLTKAKKYVDEKAIPQIQELIRKYHPDILWFDTPQKLPLSENIRILKAIRDIDNNVVVNGRLVRFANSNFGDYKNTADRPSEFYPVTGDWEAIPTTNESYGYSKFDSSHKPVSHFIRLIASAASRGGNLLMNIGPKGDGTFDQRDIKILKGIGTWMDKNSESIYESKASPLPLQSWGVSTVNGNKLYLHVFNWPSDGRLYVGGLKSPINKIYLLTDPKKQFSFSKPNAKDVLINLPLKAMDTVNTVLVVDLENSLETDSVRYVATNIPVTRLLAYDAIQQGNGFSFGDGKTDRYYVEGWKSKDQNLSWNFRTTTQANFKLIIKYLAPSSTAGGMYAVALDENYLQQYVIIDRKETTVITKELGIVPLSAGVHHLKISPLTFGKSELMKLLEVQLLPVNQQPINLSKIFSDAEQQTKVMLNEIPKAVAAKSGATAGVSPGAGGDLVSPRTLDSLQLKLVTSRDWTSGFFPGELWFLYEYTGKDEWKKQAQAFTANIEREKTNGGTHDMGFKVYCSFGEGYRLTKDAHYKDVIIQSAKTLSTRFNPKAGVIRSWDHHKEQWDYPVIIDNMMNLELLFAATKLSGDSSFYNIAVSHANTTMKNHFRPDYSSYHVVDYDTATGQVRKKQTAQGYADESAWARGQAWGLYGFTMCYRETKNRKYLEQAEHIASFLLGHANLPKDMVPYWDFNAPNIPNEPRDASAAAVMASALYELSSYGKNKNGYRNAADKIIGSLTSYYRSQIGENRGFILLHSTGSKPANSEVDVPLVYADYYYLEALLRMKKLNEGKKLFGPYPDLPPVGRKNSTQATLTQGADGNKISSTSKVTELMASPTGRTGKEATITVSSISELQAAIAKAKPGDKIIVKDGMYTTTTDINIACVGTKEHPITITAQNFGAVEISGSGGFNLVSPSAYVIIRDFKFTHAASKAKSSSGSSYCRWTNNIFETPGDGEDLTIAGNDNEVDHNTFQNKNAMGRFLAIRGTGSQIAERLWIHHNYFKSQKDQGGKNGAETLQFGLSGFSLSSSNSIVEYNLFEDCAGENEMISIKASAVILRYNTIRNCPAQFTLRHGNKCQVYGNYFFNTPGIRFFGDDHVIYSNYFENCNPAITIGNGDGEVADGAQLTAHDRPDRVLIALNILVNNKTNVVMQGRNNGLGATKINVTSNIIKGGNSAAAISGPYTDPSWSNNMIFNTVAGNMPEGSFSVKDPGLAKNESGVLSLVSDNSSVSNGGLVFKRVGIKAFNSEEVGAHPIK